LEWANNCCNKLHFLKAMLGFWAQHQFVPHQLQVLAIRLTRPVFSAVCMQPYHLIYQSQWMEPLGAAALADLLHQCRTYNRQHDITGVLLHTPEGRFLQVLEGPRTAVRHLYYHAILSDPRHHHCQVLGEGPWPQRSFATWTMGFRNAQAGDLRTLLGEATGDSLGLTPRPYPRPQLLGLVNDFVEQDPIPTWQEQP